MAARVIALLDDLTLGAQVGTAGYVGARGSYGICNNSQTTEVVDGESLRA